VPVIFEGGNEPESVKFPSLEHLMMHQKALLFKDGAMARKTLTEHNLSY